MAFRSVTGQSLTSDELLNMPFHELVDLGMPSVISTQTAVTLVTAVLAICVLHTMVSVISRILAPTYKLFAIICWSLSRGFSSAITHFRHRWVVRKEPAPLVAPDEWLVPGDPLCDPTKGIYLPVAIDGINYRVQLNPQWWAFLPATISSAREECPVEGSTMSTVSPTAEPKSLVSIQSDDGRVLGCGARMAHGSSDVFITASHVLREARSHGKSIFLAKHDRSEVLQRVKLDPTWACEFYSSNEYVDLIAIQVPAYAWSLLGVKTAPVAKVKSARTIVSAFGMSPTGKWMCSSGTALASQKPGALLHSCSTIPGWSGTPLYVGNSIIAIHRASNGYGSDTRHRNVATVLHPITNQHETVDLSAPLMEITEQEIEQYVEDLQDIPILGKGRYLTTRTQYVRPHMSESELKAKSGYLWSEVVDDDEEDESYLGAEVAPHTPVSLNFQQGPQGSPQLPPLNAEFQRSVAMDSFQRTLNSQASLEKLSVQTAIPEEIPTCSQKQEILTSTAVLSEMTSTTLPPDQGVQIPPPPCELLTRTQDTSSTTAPSLQQMAWDFKKLADQVCDLSRLLQQQQAMLSSKPAPSSPSSKSSTGRPAAQQQSCNPSSSKQATTGVRNPPRGSYKPVTVLSSATPVQNAENRRSRGMSRRSRQT